MNQSGSVTIFAVIVTYEPDEVLLSQLLLALAPQVSGGIIVNNSNSLSLSDAYLQHVGFSVQHLNSNVGVAAALNAGFNWARAQDAGFVITFDQDSEPAPDMVSRLLSAYILQMEAGHKVGAVGPQQIDRRSGGIAPFIAPIVGRRRRILPQDGQALEVDHLITSGCLMPLQAWLSTGPFLDSLFIDYVDIEWSLRMRSKGWHLYGVGGASLKHSIGDDIKHWGVRQVAWHSPLRHYYLFRNGVHLQTLPYIPLMWKLSDALQLSKKLVFFTFVGRPRIAHLKAMLLGIKHGFKKRLGPAQTPD
ncbi:MAG: glycosyltransferase family 2 protein [Polaromonas sp.]|nr:MAG: glycosyltransferase family 2 protein [Polaromonas sp.]